MTRAPAKHVRPTILHIVDTLHAGGLEANLAVLIAGTIDRYTHRVCCVRSSGIIAEHLRALDVPVTVIGKRGTRDWLMVWHLTWHCRQVRPQIVHTRNWGTVDGIVAARLARVPVVIHSEHGFDTATIPPRRHWSLWAVTPLVDRMLTVSEDLGRRLHTEFGVPARKISVVRNGVDAARFHPRSDRPAIRRKHGYADTDLIIGVAARLDPIKNHVGLINAFKRVAERRADARLLIVGEGPERERIEREVERLRLSSRVRLVGHQVDVETWLAMFDLFAYAPRFEGMPNGVLEAMATGVPVVATRVGGVPEAVIDGVTGRLVAAGDTEALVAAIELYCGDAETRAAHGAAGRARVVTEFRAESMLAAYAAAYDGAMAARSVIATALRNSREG